MELGADARRRSGGREDDEEELLRRRQLQEEQLMKVCPSTPLLWSSVQFPRSGIFRMDTVTEPPREGEAILALKGLEIQ